MFRHAAVIAAATLFAGAPAFAESSYSGSVLGFFSDPVLSGSIIAVDGSLTPLDNSATAFVIVDSVPASVVTLTWGNSTTGANPGFSYLYFTGADYTDVEPGESFKLGSISYLNGTSDLDTLIFGGKLHLILGNGIDEKISDIGIVTTANTQTSPARDADFINFGDLPGVSFNVFESGFSRIDLYGRILGDPYVTLDSINITDGFGDSGFIGTGVGGVPEPANWALLIAGFGLVGAAQRRRRASVSA